MAWAALASGFGQFGVIAALGDVARDFGRVVPGGSITDQVGLSSTELGIGLAIIRMASLASLPIVGVADRFGRRSLLLATLSLGLAMTVIAALSPGYWWFVVIFALGRPLLSSTNVLTEVIAAEQTDARDRAAAIALVAAGYGVGAGLTAVIHSLASSTLGFRGLFGLALVPLALVPFLRRWIEEPDRFRVSEAGGGASPARPGSRRVAVPEASGDHRADRVRHLGHHRSGQQLRLPVRPERAAPARVTAAMVLGAGVAGLAGLLVGRWLADHLGRRPTGALGMIGLALFGMLAYQGSSAALVVGYILGVMAGLVSAGHRRRAGRDIPHLGAGIGGRVVGGGRGTRRCARARGLRGYGRHRRSVRHGCGTHLCSGSPRRRAVLDGPRDTGARARGPLAGLPGAEQWRSGCRAGPQVVLRRRRPEDLGASRPGRGCPRTELRSQSGSPIPNACVHEKPLPVPGSTGDRVHAPGCKTWRSLAENHQAGPMLLTISTDHRPATDLGYLLHKNPEGHHTADFGFGTGRVIFPEATDNRCTAALVVDIDPVGLVRGRKGSKGGDFSLAQYVNDRPYVTSSFMSVVLGKMFSTAMSGRSKERPELAETAIPLVVGLPVTPCRGGVEVANRIFEPLGYSVVAEEVPLDPRFPGVGGEPLPGPHAVHRGPAPAGPRAPLRAPSRARRPQALLGGQGGDRQAHAPRR